MAVETQKISTVWVSKTRNQRRRKHRNLITIYNSLYSGHIPLQTFHWSGMDTTKTHCSDNILESSQKAPLLKPWHAVPNSSTKWLPCKNVRVNGNNDPPEHHVRSCPYWHRAHWTIEEEHQVVVVAVAVIEEVGNQKQREVQRPHKEPTRAHPLASLLMAALLSPCFEQVVVAQKCSHWMLEASPVRAWESTLEYRYLSLVYQRWQCPCSPWRPDHTRLLMLVLLWWHCHFVSAPTLEFTLHTQIQLKQNLLPVALHHYDSGTSWKRPHTWRFWMICATVMLLPFWCSLNNQL